MITVISILSALLVWLAYLLASDYVARARRSYSHAEAAWTKATQSAHEFLDRDIPVEVARLTIEIAALAGCGCFVRGLIAAHYLPKPPGKPGGSGRWDKAYSELEKLDSDVRQIFNEFLTHIIVYDSYRNPISGKLLRSLLKPTANSSPSMRMEKQLTVYSVVSRRQSSSRLKPTRELELA